MIPGVGRGGQETNLTFGFLHKMAWVLTKLEPVFHTGQPKLLPLHQSNDLRENKTKEEEKVLSIWDDDLSSLFIFISTTKVLSKITLKVVDGDVMQEHP